MAVKRSTSTSGFLTGISPLVLDYSDVEKRSWDMMLADKKAAIEQEREYVEQSEERLLKALSFENIQGIGQRVQMKHLETLQGLWDKWAAVFAEREGKLSMQDIALLQNDKNAVDSNLAKMQTDVKQYEGIAEIIRQHRADNTKYPDLDWSTIEQDYLAYEPFVGSGDAMKILKERYIPAIEEISDNYGKELSGKKNVADQLFLGLDDEGRKVLIKDNERQISEYFNKVVMDDPRLANKVQKEGYDKVFDQVKARYGIDQRLENYIKPSTTKTTGTYSGLTPAEKSQVDDMNYYLQVFTRGNMDKIESELINKFGIDPSMMQSSKTDDGKGNYIISYSWGTGRLINNKPEVKRFTYTIPKDQSDPNKRKKVMMSIVDKVLPQLFSGKNVPKYLQSYINPNYEYSEEFTPSLTNNGDKLLLEIDAVKPGKKIGELASSIDAYIPELYGKVSPVKEEGIFKKHKSLEIDVDGTKVIYDLTKEPDRLALKELIRRYTSIDVKVPEDVVPMEEYGIGKSESEGGYVIDGVDITKYAPEPNHESAIRNINNEIHNDIASYSGNEADYYNQRIRKFSKNAPISGDMIISTANKFGITHAILASIIELDSNYGTLGAGVETKNPGNVGNWINPDGSKKRTYFETWQEGLDAAAQWLAKHKVQETQTQNQQKIASVEGFEELDDPNSMITYNLGDPDKKISALDYAKMLIGFGASKIEAIKKTNDAISMQETKEAAASAPKIEIRIDKNTGKKAVFDAITKSFIRWAE